MRAMRIRVLLAVLVGIAAVGGAARVGAATQKPAFKAKLTAPTHTPKVKTKWYYVVRVTDLQGKPIKARLTVQIKDPIGGLSPVQYGATKKNITNWPFTGRFRDYITWPPDSKLSDSLGGLVLRATVKARGAKVVLTYRVKPR